MSSRPAAGQWTIETLRRMDWKRFQELASMLLARAGFQTDVAWVKPDGTVVLHVTGRSRHAVNCSLVQCAAWTGFHVDAHTVMEFCKAMAAEGIGRGIVITPGEVDRGARLFARNKSVELIDGVEFLGTIGRMNEDEQAYYLRLATVGPWDVPSCPSCGTKMEMGLVPSVTSEDPPRDVVFRDRTRRHVGVELSCRHLTIREGADVLFLKPVQVEAMTVEGRAMGNFVCTGKLTIASGGAVSGLVAARSIRLEQGGRLEAEARILNTEEICPVGVQPRQKAWVCPESPRCRAALPLRD